MPPHQPHTAPRLSPAKRAVILEAAEQLFLRSGYLGTSIDEIAAAARVSKPTVYRHFGSKEDLFIVLVTDITTRAGDGIHDLPAAQTVDELEEVLTGWATQQLKTVLTPRLMQMRRLVTTASSRLRNNMLTRAAAPACCWSRCPAPARHRQAPRTAR